MFLSLIVQIYPHKSMHTHWFTAFSHPFNLGSCQKQEEEACGYEIPLKRSNDHGALFQVEHWLAGASRCRDAAAFPRKRKKVHCINWHQRQQQKQIVNFRNYILSSSDSFLCESRSLDLDLRRKKRKKETTIKPL